MTNPSSLTFQSGKPALHLIQSSAKASTSHWGGVPSIPAGWVWPTRTDGARLSFLGQIDLAQSQALLAQDHLPKDGLLLFFYDTQAQPWGFDPSDRDGWKVEYVPADAALSPAHIDYDTKMWNHRSVDFRLIETYEDGCPSVQGGLSDDEMDAVMEFVADRNYGDRPHHQMGGYPDPVQGTGMEDECELASNKVYAGNPDGYSGARGQALLAAGGAADWRLVLQVDSDDDDSGPGWMWGDSGMLYFWVREADGRRGDFSKAWLVLQCC